MRKVIGGHVYDTDKATLLGEWDCGLGMRDINWERESLYRTKSGLYFVHGEGGANTRYAERSGSNTWAPGEIVIPMVPDDAREWAEENLDAEGYGRAFGLPDDGNRKMLSISTDAATYARLRDMATESGKSMSAVVTELINGGK